MRRGIAALAAAACWVGVAAAQVMVPFVNQPLTPTSVAPGGPEFTLTVHGTGFASGATVNWNGAPLKTAFLSASKLSVAVPAGDIATAQTATITVSNPGVAAASNTVFFQVAKPESTVYYADPFGALTASNGTDQLPAPPGGMAVADTEGGGREDLLFPLFGQGPQGAGELLALLGQGDGSFIPGAAVALAGENPSAIATGDFTGNGRQDVAVADEGNGAVTILLNQGGGNFTPAPGSPVAVGSAPVAIAVGDFNRDGELDLAVGGLGANSYTSAPAITILLGNGDGSFTPAPGGPIVMRYGAPYGLAVGDFNRDGILDLAVADGLAEAQVFLGRGDGTFAPAPNSPFADTPFSGSTGAAPNAAGPAATQSIVTADFNGDGALDLAVGGMAGGQPVALLLGRGDGTFTAAPPCCEAPAYSNLYADTPALAVGDFNGDGHLDLAVLTGEAGFERLQILLGNGYGEFTPTYFSSSAPGATFLGLGDFNGDGRLDFAASGVNRTGYHVYVQGAPGSAPPEGLVLAGGAGGMSIQPGDIGDADIVVLPQNGFYGPLQWSCSGAPSESTCVLSDAPQFLYPGDVQGLQTTVALTTTAPSSAAGIAPPLPGDGGRLALALLALAGMMALWWRLARARAPGWLALAVLLGGLGLAACGGSATPPAKAAPPLGSGTPAGNYTLTVTVRSPVLGGIRQSITIPVTVQ